MAILRHLPPVLSPVRPLASLKAVGGGGRRALASLEDELCRRYRADAAVLCGSGTEALNLALRLARERTGRDAAAVPAYGCYDIVSAMVGAGATPLFYDIDPDTLTPAPASMAAALSAAPAAVVVVHHYGIPSPVEPPGAAVPPDALVIEDAAQAHGGVLGNRPLGSLAAASVLSFGRGKGWTGGAGGALLLRGEAADLADALRRRLTPPGGAGRSTARLLAQWALGRPAVYAAPAALPWLGLGETRYVPPIQPRSMPPAVAGIVLANAAASDREAGVRLGIAVRLKERLRKIPALRIPGDGATGGVLRLPLRIPGRAAADLPPDAAALGLVPAYPVPLPALGAVRRTRAGDVGAPGAATLARELFTAPTHSFVRPSDIERIGRLLERAA